MARLDKELLKGLSDEQIRVMYLDKGCDTYPENIQKYIRATTIEGNVQTRLFRTKKILQLIIVDRWLTQDR